MKRATAEMLADARRPRDLIEQHPFTLPQHMRWTEGRAPVPRGFVHVIGDIYRWAEIKIQPAAAEPLNTDEDWKRVTQASCKPQVEKDVVSSAAEAEIALRKLVQLARNGNGKALWQFANLACQVVEGLNEIARSNPDAIKPFARHLARWPMMRSTHPLNCDDDGLLEKIELGKSSGVQLDKYSKWKPDYASNIAGALVGHIQAIRRQNPKPYCIHEKQKVYFADFLRPFSKETAPRWWFIAQKFWFATYPKPEAIAELDALVTAESKRKSPGRRRAAIIEKIRARFFHLACPS